MLFCLEKLQVQSTRLLELLYIKTTSFPLDNIKSQHQPAHCPQLSRLFTIHNACRIQTTQRGRLCLSVCGPPGRETSLVLSTALTFFRNLHSPASSSWSAISTLTNSTPMLLHWLGSPATSKPRLFSQRRLRPDPTGLLSRSSPTCFPTPR